MRYFHQNLYCDTLKPHLKFIYYIAFLVITSLTFSLQGCGGGDVAPSDSSATSTDGYNLSLSLSKNSIISDDSDNAIVTASILKNNIGVAGANVTFSATGGQLSSASSTTGPDGKAQVTITSGLRANNQTITITASISGVKTSIPLQITGNQLSFAFPTSKIDIGVPQTLTTTLLNATNLGIADATISYSIASGSDVISLSSNSSTTNFAGQAVITVTFKKAGTAVIQASCMGITTNYTVSSSNVQNYNIYISSSKPSIVANDTDSSTITATILNGSIGQSGLTVTFAASDGRFSATTAVTDANGKASVSIFSGSISSNRTINITASANGLTATVPVQVVANSLTLSFPQTSMMIGNNQLLTATLQNGAGQGIANTEITYTILSGSGAITLSSTKSTTNASGQAQITVTAAQSGTAVIQATSMGVSSQISVTVASTAGYVLSLSLSKTSILSNDTDSSVITATVLKNSVGQAGLTVTFSTDGGRLSGNTMVTGADGKASVTITSGTRTDNRTIIISASIPGGATATIPLQITGNKITLSVPQTNLVLGTNETLTAQLQNGDSIGIPDTSVLFLISAGADVINISKSFATTDANGNATIQITGIKTGSAVIEASAMGITSQITINVATEGGYKIILTPSKQTIKSDNSDSAVITATAMKDSVVQAGVPITFTASGGLLSADSGTTNASGTTTVTLTSGPQANNQIVGIGASAGTATATIPIEITGNTLSLSIPKTILGVGTTQELTAKAQNAIPMGVPNIPITFLIASGTDVVSLSSATATTGVNGEAKITVNALKPGTAEINALGLGISQSIPLTITNAAIRITSPANPGSLSTSDTGGLSVVVYAPPPTATVVFQTTIGTFDKTEVAVDPGTRTATAHLTSTTASGTATVDVYDKDSITNTDSIHVNIYAPATEADNVSIQAIPQNNIAVSPAGSSSKNSLTIRASVRNIKDFPVGNAVVFFTLSNTTGGGEYLSSGMALTDTTGTADVTFYSGTRGSSAAGVKVTATVSATGKSDSRNIIIKELAASIALTLGNKITILNNTTYQQDITASVVDSNNNPVNNAVVSLSLWPTEYYLGHKYAPNGVCSGYTYNDWPTCSQIFPQQNEDLNKNFILDPGEDTGPYWYNSATGITTMQADGLLTPASAEGGSVPATATTDSTGNTTFQITYSKASAMWVGVQLTASTKVQGSESQAKMQWVLEAELGEYNSCQLFDSRYGFYNEACPQSITFADVPGGIGIGGTGSISAYASSGLPVTFTSKTPTICSVGTSTLVSSTKHYTATVTGIAAGVCTIAADQAGNGYWLPAPQVSTSFSVN